MTATILHGFCRSSASWRVRIALHLKGVLYEQKSYALRNGEQRSVDFLGFNPQGLVPALEIDGLTLTQSIAICEYLDETRPEPRLLPVDVQARARVRAMVLAIACDVHPVQNLKVLQSVAKLANDGAAGDLWARNVCDEGLDAFADMVAPVRGSHCFGDKITLADIALIPQMANARRFGVDIRWPDLVEIEAQCLASPAFRETAPDRQPDFSG
jgi:maleylpyruvate isomerase